MKLSRKSLWSIIVFLLLLLTAETYFFRNEIKSTFKYYKDKIVEIYNDFQRQDEVRE